MSELSKKDAIGQAIQERNDLLAEKHEREVESRGERSQAVQDILDEFAHWEQRLQQSMTRARTLPSEDELDITETLDEISTQLPVGEKLLAQNQSALPKYEVKRLQNCLRERWSEYMTLQNEVQPKKKFGFKGRKVKKAEKAPPQPPPPTTTKTTAPTLTHESNGFTLADQSDATLRIEGSQIRGQDVLLRDLVRCRISLMGNPSTVHMTNLEDCTILLGPVSTSAFIDNSRNCRFVLACQQLRTHSTTNSHFYIHVTSKAIIEDCSNLQFAPYAWSYEGLSEDFQRTGLDWNVNNWNKVDDFNWLASDQASPNWSVLQERQDFTVA